MGASKRALEEMLDSPRYKINQIRGSGSVNAWEEEFVTSVEDLISKNIALSDAQEAKLSEILEKTEERDYEYHMHHKDD